MSEHVVDHIAEYLDGELSKERERTFEEHIASCADCAADVAYARAFRESALEQGLMHPSPARIVELGTAQATATDVEKRHLAACESCRKELEWVAQDDADSGPPGSLPSASEAPRSGTARRWAPPILAIAAIAIFVVLLPRESPLDPDRIRSAARLEPIPVNVTRSAPETDERARGLEAYREGNYTAAREHLRRAVETSSDAELLLYLGSSALLVGDPEAATRHFSACIATSDNAALREEAEWQLANATLALGELDPARVQLNTLAIGDGRRAGDAAELLRELEP